MSVLTSSSMGREDLTFALQPSACIYSEPDKALLCLDFTSAPLLSSESCNNCLVLHLLRWSKIPMVCDFLRFQCVTEPDFVRLKVCFFGFNLAWARTVPTLKT